MNRKVVSLALSLIVVVSMVGFYVASAKTDGGGSPWESILAVFVTGGSVNISSPVVLEAGTSVDVSGSVSLEPGSEVGVYGEVSLEEGTEVGVSGEVSISGPVTIDGPVTLSPGSTVEAVMATEVVEVFYGNMEFGDAEGWAVDVDGYKTVHIYWVYSTGTYPDAYSLSMTLSIPDPHGGFDIAWQSESLPGPGVYSYEVTGPQLSLHLHGWTGANVTECRLFVYAQSG